MRYLDIHLTLDMSSDARRRYEHSKLYFTQNPRAGFSEDQVICFRIPFLREAQHVRIKLPDALQTRGKVQFRLDPAASLPSRYQLHGVFLIGNHDGSEATRLAELHALKQRTREEVVASEFMQRAECPHFPESLNVELTARCNLTCSQCSSHGTPELHAHHNAMSEMPVSVLEKLSEEVFPALTSIVLVGRGEPLAVTETLWNTFRDACIRHRVLLGVVTNASYLRRRIVSDLLPWVDRVTVSIDGFSPEIFAANRGGADLNQVLRDVAAFHEQRNNCGVTRRPRLCFSWTLKKNNIAEFPAFARFAAEMEADAVYVRHLLVYHEKDRAQGLIECQDLAEPYLREAYAILDGNGIPKDCPPLVGQIVTESSAGPDAPVLESGPALLPDDRCSYFHRTGVIHHDGKVPTCSVPFAETTGNIFESSTYGEVWNGAVMQQARRDFGTEREWAQCRSCWFRE